MADAVEQVYVWDGNDWTPVVRDATVEKTSELTNDGEDGINPFITAADIPDIPDKNLPIDSADGTVILDSPSANTFNISTGGSERVRVNSSGMNVVSANGKNLTALTSGNSVSIFDIDAGNTVANSAFGIKVDGTYRFYMLANGNVGIGDTPTNPNQKLTVYGDVSGDSFVKYGSSSCGVFFPTSTSVEIHPGSAQVSFSSDSTTTCVGGPNANDACAVFDSWIKFSTNNFERLCINYQGDIVAADDYVPQQPQSLATKQMVDEKIWVGTTAQYQAIVDKNPKTLYALTD